MEGNVHSKVGETERAKVWIERGKVDQKGGETQFVQLWVDGRKTSSKRWRDGTR